MGNHPSYCQNPLFFSFKESEQSQPFDFESWSKEKITQIRELKSNETSQTPYSVSLNYQHGRIAKANFIKVRNGISVQERKWYGYFLKL